MTKRNLSMFMLSAVALAVSAIPAKAIEFGLLRVNVPFAFRAGTVTLPAGNYSFVRENQSGLVRISGSTGSVLLITHPGQAVSVNEEPSVAFHKSGGIAILEQLRLGGDASEVMPVSNVR